MTDKDKTKDEKPELKPRANICDVPKKKPKPEREKGKRQFGIFSRPLDIETKEPSDT